MGTVTDSFTMNIQIIQHGLAKIYNPVAPKQVEKDTPFDITYDCKNEGLAEDTLCGSIKNEDGSIIPGSEWQEVIAIDATVSKSFTHPGITKNVTLTLEVGHR